MNKAKALMAAVALTVGMSAQAADYVSVGELRLSETVKYGDLDLNRSQDASRLYKRLDRAARNVCAPLRGRSVTPAAKHRACVNEAVAKAVSEVDQPLLTQYHKSKGDQGSAAIVARR